MAPGEAPRSAGPQATALDPGSFAEMASGVVPIRGLDCSGVPRLSGTGFLVGASVVMTARHVVDPAGSEKHFACKVLVKVDGRWVKASKVSWWAGGGDPTGRSTDLATVKLSTPASDSDFIFGFRESSPPLGTNLSMLGYPLANGISLTQGHLFRKTHLGTVPLLLIDLLGAEGASGSPIVDDAGNVVGVLQLGLGGKDVLGQRTSGVIAGIDIIGWWGSGEKASKRLCQVYPTGGIAGCDSAAPTPPPTPTPPVTTPAPTPPAPAPAPTPAPPAPTPAPAPVGWPPSGYSQWTGPGTYDIGDLAWQNASCQREYEYSTACWGVTIASRHGCRDDAFVNVDIFDSAGHLVDTGIDEVSFIGPGQAATAHGDTFSSAPASYRITSIDCFNF